MTAEKWDSYPSFASQDYFGSSMEGHTRVREVAKRSPTRWDLTLTNEVDVRVFITDVYTFSVADYTLLRAAHPEVDIILSASMWNHFSSEAVEAADEDGVATVKLGGELMSVIHDFANGRATQG